MIRLLALLLIATPALALDVTLTGKIEQGGVALGTAPVGSRVTFAKHEIAVAPDGRFVVGFDRDAGAKADLVVTGPDGAREVKHLAIAKRPWVIDRVDGVQQELVTPDPELLKKIIAENKFWAAARKQTELTPYFEGGFIVPAAGRISGHFGNQRILNGEPRAPHTGLDIAAPVGAPVHAAADGVVSMKKDMLIMTGNTVMINHGYGLQTFYIHMSKLYVSDGQKVKQGDVIGEIGMTGRATGPHLHFGATWFDQRLDPETVLAALAAPSDPGAVMVKFLGDGKASIGGKVVAVEALEAEVRAQANTSLRVALDKNSRADAMQPFLKRAQELGWRVSLVVPPS